MTIDITLMKGIERAFKVLYFGHLEIQGPEVVRVGVVF